MEFFSNKTHFPFMAKRKPAMWFSIALISASLISLAWQQLNFGVDFTGGTLIEVGYTQAANLDKIRTQLKANAFGDASAQNFGSATDILIRVPPREGISNDKLSNQVMQALQETGAGLNLRRVEFVGPQVGEELVQGGFLALFYAFLGILIYVATRFEYRFAIGAVAALIHDTIITLGVFSWTQAEFNLTVLAAILAVIGYSLNDTIVVFDRVRDNFRTRRKEKPVAIFDISLNETLSRTIMTSFTTSLVVVVLFFFGGEVIHNFAMALMVGIVIGTYSSIYIASAITLNLGISSADLMPVKKEGQDLSHIP